MRPNSKQRYQLLSLLFFLLFSYNQRLLAQDVHFSELQQNPLFLTPSYAGFFDGSIRSNAAYRNQWNTVTVPYQTLYFSTDLQLLKRNYKQDMLGLGVSVFRDIAGDSDYGTLQANLSFSYVKGLNRQNNHFIGIGAGVGLGQRSIRYNDLYFDNQWDGYLQNSNMPQNESFSKTQFWYYDVSAGAHWFYQVNKDFGMEAGLGLWHLNQPTMTWFSDEKVILAQKISVFVKTPISLNDNIILSPQLAYFTQSPYQELVLGGQLKFFTDTRSEWYSAINAGVFLRNQDAIILMLGVDYQKFQINFSYDLNFSKLEVASRSQGGPEISLQYIINRKPKNIKKEIPCPIF